MKKILLIAVLLLTVSCIPAFADSIPSNLEIFDETTVGAKIDAPNLFLQYGNHSLGCEVGLTNLFEDWDQSGYAIVKYTFKGSLFNLDK